MRLVRQAPGSAEIHGRTAARAPLLVGLALLIVPLGAALARSARATGLHLVVSAVVAAVALGLVWAGWPRRRRLRVAGPPPTVSVDGAPPSKVPADAVLRLGASPGAADGPPRYALLLSRAGTPDTVLLEDANPAIVLADLSGIAPLFGDTALVSGWGLPSIVPSWIRARGGVAPDGRTADVARATRQDATARRDIARIVAVGAVGAVTILGFEIRGRVALGETPSGLDLALPLLLAVGLLAIAWVVLTTHDHVFLDGDELVHERRTNPFTLLRETVPLRSIRHAYLVGGEQGPQWHLLLDTEKGPEAFPCDATTGPETLATVLRAITGAGR